MMKFLKFIAALVLFVCGFFASVWHFLPWREVGAASMSVAASQLERRGMRISYSEVEDADGGFTVRDLSIGGFVSLSLESVTITPQLGASVMALAPMCSVSFKGGSMTMGQVMDLGSGRFLLTAGMNEIMLENIRTNGDFALNGFMSVIPSTMRIGRAEASLRIPESFESNMETLTNFLPLVREGNGNWFLRR